MHPGEGGKWDVSCARSQGLAPEGGETAGPLQAGAHPYGLGQIGAVFVPYGYPVNNSGKEVEF